MVNNMLFNTKVGRRCPPSTTLRSLTLTSGLSPTHNRSICDFAFGCVQICSMKLSNEQIKLLLDKFVASEEAQTWRKQRWKDHKRWKEWIDPDKLDTLSDDELKNRFLEYFNEGAGRHPFNAVYRDRIVRDIKKFRKVIKFTRLAHHYLRKNGGLGTYIEYLKSKISREDLYRMKIRRVIFGG